MTNPIGSMASLLAQLEWQKKQLPPEERERREQAAQEERERRRQYYMILQNQCPSCEGKLTRGKKDKKRDYRRGWQCAQCEDTWWM